MPLKSPTTTRRYRCTQLVLWPDQRMSFAAVQESSVLQDLVFTGASSTLYTHTTHRLYPLKTSSQAGAELTEISSMVSGDKTSPCSTPVDSRSTSNSNSPYTYKDKGRGQHGSSGCLRNGLTESLHSPSLPSPSPTPSSPSSFSQPCQDKNNCASLLSPLKLSSLRKRTGILSSNGHIHSGSVESRYNGEMSNDPCNNRTDELAEYEEEKPIEESVAGNDECRDLLCMPTYMPKFLLAYTPLVSYCHKCMCTCTCICIARHSMTSYQEVYMHMYIHVLVSI